MIFLFVFLSLWKSCRETWQREKKGKLSFWVHPQTLYFIRHNFSLRWLLDYQTFKATWLRQNFLSPSFNSIHCSTNLLPQKSWMVKILKIFWSCRKLVMVQSTDPTTSNCGEFCFEDSIPPPSHISITTLAASFTAWRFVFTNARPTTC